MSYWQGHREFIARVLQEVSPQVLESFRLSKDELQLAYKGDGSYVTAVDQQTEERIRASISTSFPEDSIYGEEGGMMSFGTRGIWVIDPIDGTRNFVFHNPLFGTLLGYLFQNRVVVGGVALPVFEEIWLGEIGQPTTCNGKEVGSSGLQELSRARMVATSPDYFKPWQAKIFEAVSAEVEQRQFGGDCTLFTALASGGVDIVMEAGLHPHDYLPLVPIVEGAGGVISDWYGAALNFDNTGEVLACASKELHDVVLERLRELMPSPVSEL